MVNTPRNIPYNGISLLLYSIVQRSKVLYIMPLPLGLFLTPVARILYKELKVNDYTPPERLSALEARVTALEAKIISEESRAL